MPEEPDCEKKKKKKKNPNKILPNIAQSLKVEDS
jgi:hypothetical protein